MLLTIAIPTVLCRLEQFTLLYEKVKAIASPDAEVIFLSDNKEISIGAKRQMILEMAKGEYVVMIDDDDDVSESYCRSIISALESRPDCVGFEIRCSGTPGITASASNRWDDWAENVGGFDYVRTPYQKTPIKTSIARQIGYKDVRFGEDYDFSRRLKLSGLIQNEVYIPEVLYFYRYKFQEPTIKYGL